MLLGDHNGLSTLSGLFSFAAHSRHTLVHIPLREGVPPDEGESRGERVDLVLAHHTLGLRPSQWPGLRAKLRRPTPLTAHTDEARTTRDAATWQAHKHHADFRDDLRHSTHARTLFLFGSREVFAATATEFAHAAGWGPRQKGVAKGHSALMTGLPLVQPPGGGHPLEVLVCFKPYPPYAHFRPPGRHQPPTSRPPRPAASP